MTHLQEEQLMDAYYGDLALELSLHLDRCRECRLRFDRLSGVLDSVREHPVPERGAGYGGEVWTRLLPLLPEKKSHWLRRRWWTLVPALAALVVIAFVGGMLTQQRRTNGFPDKARERVLLIALSDHLERSQIVLAQLLNSAPSDIDLGSERDRARDLIDENRLLRETALHMGDNSHAALLDDLERVLLDVANSPSDISTADLARLQHRIEEEGLLFKVRITSMDARARGQKL